MTAEETLAEKKNLKERDKAESIVMGFYGKVECPNCHRWEYLFGMKERNRFCGNCGQRLKWADEE